MQKVSCKRLLIFLVAAGIIIWLASCGSGAAPGANGSDEPAYTEYEPSTEANEAENYTPEPPLQAAPIPIAILPGAIIWSMQGDAALQSLPLGSSTFVEIPMLEAAGATTTIIENPTDPTLRSIQITERANDWHGLAILRAGLDAAGMLAGNSYEITIIGTAGTLSPDEEPTGTSLQMVLRQSGNPWNNLSAVVDVSPATRDFTVEWTFYPQQANLAGQNMRIQTTTAGNSPTMPFVIHDIIVKRAAVGPAAYTLAVNGAAGSVTTSEIAVSLFRGVTPEISAADVILNPRATDAVLVPPYLTKIAADEYILHIGGATRWGYVGVTINHPDIQNEESAIMINHAEGRFMPNHPLRSYFPWINDPNFRELMPVDELLNDPFQFFATTDGQCGGYGEVIPGRVVTLLDWEHRRAELRDLIMYYYIGYIHQTPIDHVTVNTAARPDNDGVINLTVDTFNSDGTPVSQTFDVAEGIWLPSEAQLAANGFAETGGPIIIGLGATLTEDQRNAALERGIGVAVIHARQMEPSPWSAARPTAPAPSVNTRNAVYFELFPFNANSTYYNSGELAAAAWTVSRLLDAFELNPQWGVNPKMSATIGNSFQGKRALFGAVMDDRVALALPHESGGDGGMAPFRHTHAGRVNYHSINSFQRALPRHETPRTGQNTRTAGGQIRSILHTTQEDDQSVFLVPFDTHLFAALQAGSTGVPTANSGRALISLETTGFGHWTGWGPNPNVTAAANEVSAFLGYDGNIITFQKASSHSFHDSDYPVIFAAIDYIFGQPVHHTPTGFRGGRTVDQVYVEDILAAAVPGIWDGGIRALERTPIEVDSWAFPWARPNAHLIWTETMHITEGLPATIVAHTDAPYVELIRWSHGDRNNLWRASTEHQPEELARWRVAAAGGIATFNLAAGETGIGRFELRTDGGELENRSAFFQGIDVNTALIQSYVWDSAVYFGFVSRFNREAVRVYSVANGVRTLNNSSMSQGVSPTWIAPHGIRAAAIAGSGDERYWIFDNLVFDALPGFAFQLNLQASINDDVGDSWGVNDMTWAPSAAVQNIGPYPGFRPAGNSTDSWARPDPGNLHAGSMSNRGTSFDRVIESSIGEGEWDASSGRWTRLDMWELSFSDAINPRDFGIGFDFSSDFELVWNETNTMLRVYFNEFEPSPYSADDKLNMLIMRIRNDGPPVGETRSSRVGNMYNGVKHLYLPSPR
ncbi:MAG: hypothetical protein FWC78_08140 [Defluviitaleaceae bacterium]|nr:hypothetical protein [Defluviitaleaceae bacterium]